MYMYALVYLKKKPIIFANISIYDQTYVHVLIACCLLYIPPVECTLRYFQNIIDLGK